MLPTDCQATTFYPSLSAKAATLTLGSLIRTASTPTVYFYGPNGKRFVFPNEQTYFTWYSDFNSVTVVSDSQMASLPIGGNVTYRPGKKMVKVTTAPTVYVVTSGGVLRAIPSEAVAAQLYGANWNTMVDDIPDAFFVNYTVGTPLVSAGDFAPASALAAASSLNVALGGTDTVATTGIAPKVGDCQIFPSDNPWNTDISSYPVHPNSAAFIASIGATKGLHPDFGADPTYGIPFNVVDASQPKVPITFDAYGDESDPGPYPIPADAKVEADGDGHVLVLDKAACILYELYDARKNTNDAGWTAESGAVFNLKSNALRPTGWTSADAAGLPLYPGLVKYSEVQAGAINHAIRFSARVTRKAFIPPATHQAGSTSSANAPPMGLRLRLKASFDISGFSKDDQVILTAMKKYGLILADNGSDWFFQGEQGAAWNDDELNQLKSITGSNFEAVYTGDAVTE